MSYHKVIQGSPRSVEINGNGASCEVAIKDQKGVTIAYAILGAEDCASAFETIAAAIRIDR